MYIWYFMNAWKIVLKIVRREVLRWIDYVASRSQKIKSQSSCFVLFIIIIVVVIIIR